MTGWRIDTPLNRFGWEDDEGVDDPNPADWNCWLVNRETGTNLMIQFARKGNDRAAAEKIVERILGGLNA